jgi:hypothetical protein
MGNPGDGTDLVGYDTRKLLRNKHCEVRNRGNGQGRNRIRHAFALEELQDGDNEEVFLLLPRHRSILWIGIWHLAA